MKVKLLELQENIDKHNEENKPKPGEEYSETESLTSIYTPNSTNKKKY